MQTYDFLMLLVLGGLTIFGYFKGMAWQLAYLASFVASYFVAVKFADRFAPVFGDSAPWNKLIAMAVIYAATSFAIWMLFRVVRSAIDSAKLDGFDHQMGAIIGAVRGVVWCLGITFVSLTFLTRFVPGIQQHIVSSRSGHYIARFIDESESLFPPEVHQVIGPYLQQIDQRLDPNQPQPLGFGGQPGGFSSQPTGSPSGVGQPTGGNFLNGLSGQVAQQVDQLRNNVQAGVQNELQNQFNNGLRSVGLTPNAAGAPAAQPARPLGLPAWPSSTNGFQHGVPAASNAAPRTPATPAGWPAPPAGTGYAPR